MGKVLSGKLLCIQSGLTQFQGWNRMSCLQGMNKENHPRLIIKNNPNIGHIEAYSPPFLQVVIMKVWTAIVWQLLKKISR